MRDIQYRRINDLPITMDELQRWADSRPTSDVVALAIHAIASSDRTADDIWQEPTPAEVDHVRMALENYVSSGLYEPQDQYHWGVESITI